MHQTSSQAERYSILIDSLEFSAETCTWIMSSDGIARKTFSCTMLAGVILEISQSSAAHEACFNATESGKKRFANANDSTLRTDLNKFTSKPSVELRPWISFPRSSKAVYYEFSLWQNLAMEVWKSALTRQRT